LVRAALMSPLNSPFNCCKGIFLMSGGSCIFQIARTCGRGWSQIGHISE
jgi:hypothetical protein